MTPMASNAGTISKMQQLLHQLMTVEGAPALSSEQVHALLERIREEAELPAFPWTQELDGSG